MKHLSILLIIFCSLISCSEKKSKTNSLTDYIPNNPSVIISAPSIEKLQNELGENAFLNSFKSTNTFKKIKHDFSFCNEISSGNPILISYATVGKSLEYLFTTKVDNTTTKIYTSEKKKSYNAVLYKELKNQKAYTLILDSTLVVSSSEILIENLIRNTTDGIKFNDNSFFKLHNTSDASKISAYLNNEKRPAFFKSIFPTHFLGRKNWTSLEFTNHEGISINGITTNNEINHDFATHLVNSKTESSNSSQITPLNFSKYTTFTFEELKNYSSSSENFTKLITNSTETTSILEGKNSLCAFKLLDNYIDDNLNELSSYRNTTIYENNYYKIPVEISKKQPGFACYLGDYLILSNTVSTLENCISHYQNKTTLNHQHFFTENNKELLGEAHITNITKTHVLKDELATVLDDVSIKKVNLNKFPVFMNQISYEDNYINFNSVIKKINLQKTKASISQISSINLPSEINRNPQWVINHKTNEKELVIQDNNNVLYLISNKGSILWKKKLDTEIQGEIIQVDLFKNRKFQMAFTTKNEFLVLDRNGNIVDQFHKKFSTSDVLPLAVFDYDKNRNYRFVISHGNNVELYDNSFKKLKGFEFTKTESNILNAPQHILLGTKDYIVIPEENGKLHILNRQGKSRTNIKTKFDFDESAFSNHKNNIVFKDAKNAIHSINISSGKTSKIDLLQGENTNIITHTSEVKAKLEDHILTINNKTTELEYGNYSAPKIFNFNNKNYINITDLDSKKVYLYNYKGELLDQFPVYGQSAIALTNMDKDSKLEFAVKGESNSLLIYKMH